MASVIWAKDFKEVLVELTHDGKVATLWLNRPSKGNSITPQMTNELIQALEKLEKEVGVHVVVLSGKGKFFCTGMDLSSSNQQDMDQKLQEGNAAANPMKLFLKLLQCPKPVICVINGPVMGGGNGLVFGCDIRISTKDSFFSFPEVKRGIVPALISSIIVPQLGQFQSKQHFLLGARIPANELYRIGMLSSVVENDALLKEECQKYVTELLSSAPEAMAEIKKLVDFTTFNSHQDNVAHVQKVFQRTVHSEEAMYGISCFLKKQIPDWTTFHNQKIKSKL